MSKELGPRPNLEHLRKQAKELKKSQSIPLHEAQTVLAREYGFASWPKMVRHVEALHAASGITPQVELEFCEAATSDDVSRVRRLLELYPDLPRFSAACALASGSVDLVLTIDPTLKLAPLDVFPLEYVAYSQFFRAAPAAYESLLECARDLLDRGADPNCYRTFEGARLPVLYGAAGESGHVGIVRLLLERGASPNDGESIYHAAEHDFEDVLSVLVEFGADISRCDPQWGNTPLYFLSSYRPSYAGGEAAFRGMRWLLEHGADPNVASGEWKETPLHYACRRGQGWQVIVELLEHGADPWSRDKDGRTPYEVALIAGNGTAVRLLTGFQPEINDDVSFLSVCAFDKREEIEVMLRRDPSLVSRLQDQASELMCQFAETNQLHGLRGLLFAGFPVSGFGTMTPLHFACINGWVSAVSLLLAHGAPLDIRDEDHDSLPFGWATWGSISRKNEGGDYPRVVRILLDAGSSREEAAKHLDWPELGEDVKEAIRDGLAA